MTTDARPRVEVAEPPIATLVVPGRPDVAHGERAVIATPDGRDVLDEETRVAIRASHLGTIPFEAVEAFARDAIHLDVRAGTLVLRESEASVSLVVDGVLRLFMTSPTGRQTTLRYIRRGGLLGIATLFGGAAHVGARALVDARLLVFRSSLLREAALSDGRVAVAFLQETSERVNDYVNELGGSVFSTVRQRIVRHLLDSAVVDEAHGAVVATLSQQELADAAGSLRETVVRVLRELREAGLVQTGRTGITLLDPYRLEDELWIPGR